VTAGSIRLRLLAAAAVAIGIALVVAEIGLTYLFERHIERGVDADLAVHLRQLIAAITLTGGKVAVGQQPGDPRFDQPFSGLYWQIEAPDGTLLFASRSLWDGRLALPKGGNAVGGREFSEITGPDGALLRALVQTVEVEEPRSAGGATMPLRVVVAIDHRQLTAASREFAVDLVPAMAILALLLIAAVWIQVAVGLTPFDRLRTAVSDVIQGRRRRLPVDVPREVRPLADEINRLLEAQEQVLAKARARAADLAHGLKTPLQVLAADVRTLRRKGETEIADEINEVAETLRRHVDRELARARIGTAAAAAAHESNFHDIANRVVNVLQRTPRGQALDFAIEAPAALMVPLDEADLAETIGNLAENASRFARHNVRIAATATPAAVEIAVADDGPGIPAEQHERALARGASLDTRMGGTGLGLAIVAETAEAYGGALRLEDAEPGLRAVVTIPLRRAR
jgi:signal transduction histidine kinase